MALHRDAARWSSRPRAPIREPPAAGSKILVPGSFPAPADKNSPGLPFKGLRRRPVEAGRAQEVPSPEWPLVTALSHVIPARAGQTRRAAAVEPRGGPFHFTANFVPLPRCPQHQTRGRAGRKAASAGMRRFRGGKAGREAKKY